MKAVIFPFQQAEPLLPFRSLCPDFLITLVGKPVVEHIVEQLVTAEIRDITLLCDDRPEDAGRYFGNGERWGASLKISAVRDNSGVQRMFRAALHGFAGRVLCLPGNIVISEQITDFLPEPSITENAVFLVSPDRNLMASDASAMLSLMDENTFETFDELVRLATQKQSLTNTDFQPEGEGNTIITDFSGFLKTQRNLLEGKMPGCRIPASETAKGIWIGDHAEISPGVRLVAPLFIGSHCRISGNGQIGPNAVIAPYCLINDSDLICDSLIMSGTAVGSHTELNGMAARGGSLLNLKTGAVVFTPDPFILGDVGAESSESSGGFGEKILAMILLLLLMPLGLPLLLLSFLSPSIVDIEKRSGNRRMKTLGGENPRLPFTLRQFTLGPLLLRRWPTLTSLLTGDLRLVGGSPSAVVNSRQSGSETLFGLDVARGLFHIWEIEGELPESIEERQARENFHAVTRTFAGDIKIILSAAVTFPPD